jgi:hypothetical protein
VNSTAVGRRARRAVLDLDRRVLRDVLGAWALSRVLCFGAGILAIVVLGAHAGPHDPFGSTTPFGDFRDDLVGPGVRWDSIWYLLIADHGYVAPRVTEFYPVYPLAARLVGAPFGSSVIGGLLVSLAALFAALYLLERLAAREVGPERARRVMLLLAFFPTSVFFSAVYTEGLFLALTIGAVYAARSGRWALAGLVGGVAAMTRPTGLLVLVPLALLYLYGPRDDQPGPARGRGLWPRYRPRLDALWLLALPAGLAAYMVYTGTKFDEPFVILKQGAAWHQGFSFPLATVWHAAKLAATGALDIFHGKPPDDIYEFGFFLFACIAALGALRRFPIAYGAYAAVGILFIVSFPIRGESLSSFSRYMTPLFPILMWLAVWSSERRVFKWVLVGFGALMVVNSARFATWHFVG